MFPKLSIFCSLASALVPAEVFGKYSLPAGPAAIKANETLNTWLVAKKGPDGKKDIAKAGGSQKYICGTSDAAIKPTKTPSFCVPETSQIEVKLLRS